MASVSFGSLHAALGVHVLRGIADRLHGGWRCDCNYSGRPVWFAGVWALQEISGRITAEKLLHVGVVLPLVAHAHGDHECVTGLEVKDDPIGIGN